MPSSTNINTILNMFTLFSGFDYNKQQLTYLDTLPFRQPEINRLSLGCLKRFNQIGAFNPATTNGFT